MSKFVLGFQEMEGATLSLVGGKALNLAQLSNISDIRVPEGFCVTTAAYRKAFDDHEGIVRLQKQLSRLQVEDRDGIRDISGRLRQLIAEAALPPEVAEAVKRYLSRFGTEHAYAVRSSATAEDLPHASFAGQQDSYLNIIGEDAVLRHIRLCWASLYTDRSVIYRMRNGYAHDQVYLAVIIQRMIDPAASGILFTADPVSSNRKLLSIDAGYGLGEALVSGLVSADGYHVRDGEIVDKRIAAKHLAIYGQQEGGTAMQPIEPDRQSLQVLSDDQIIALAGIGRRIEAYYGSPQDIEWCLADDTFHIVQSRPITTLYPIPEAEDADNRVYVSVGHQQMMTDPILPLGLSFFLMTTFAPMKTAGGRLFVDVTGQLASPATRDAVLHNLGQSDPLIKDALLTIIERGDFIQPLPDAAPAAGPDVKPAAPAAEPPTPPAVDPGIVDELILKSEASLEELKRRIRSKSGSELFDFIREDMQQFKADLFNPQSMSVIMAAMQAAFWLNDKMHEWLGVKHAADTLSQSVSRNVTSEMGLALLDVADAIRPFPALVAYLQHTEDERFLEHMDRFDGGPEARGAIRDYLDRYGMRCPGEIDVTRTRWSENPAALLPVIVGHIRNAAPGAGKLKFKQGLLEASKMEDDLLHRLQQLPDGESKAQVTKRMIDNLRHFTGYREYPKYSIVNRYFVYKQALLKEAEQLARAGVMKEREDAYYLSFEEFHEAVRTRTLDARIVERRKDAYRLYAKLTPPRVMTSDGEILTGKYRREELPADALVGLPVSSGIIEGRARVIRKMEEADLEPGDILVTAFTDPSWTPLFVSIAGLVTEVGGLMTHGAVIAREYGLPAVVGVEHATTLIRDGQYIRVNGTEGYIELLD